MKHLAKRSLSLLLAVLMVLSLCPVTALTVFAEHIGEWTYKSSYEWINGSFKTEDTDLVYEGDQPYDWSVVITPQKTPSPSADVVASIKDAQGNLVSEYTGTAEGLAQHTEGTLCSFANFPELTTDLEGTFTLTCRMLYKGTIYAQLVQTFSRTAAGGAGEETTEGAEGATTVATTVAPEETTVATEPDPNEKFTFTDGWSHGAADSKKQLNGFFITTEEDLTYEGDKAYDWTFELTQNITSVNLIADAKILDEEGNTLFSIQKTVTSIRYKQGLVISAEDFPELTADMVGNFILKCQIIFSNKDYGTMTQRFSRVADDGETPDDPGTPDVPGSTVTTAKAYLDLTQSAIVENITGIGGLNTASNPPVAISVATVIRDDIVAWDLGRVALCFTLSEEFLKDFDGNARITVEYFDVGTGTASLVYHSTGSTEAVHPTTMAPAGNKDFSVQTAVFELTDAVFTNLYEKGSSFAILCFDGRFYLKSVTVTKNGCAHDWTDATCTAPKTCSLCGVTEGEALGHSYENGVCSRCQASNIEDGDIEYITSKLVSATNPDLVFTEGEAFDLVLGIYNSNPAGAERLEVLYEINGDGMEQPIAFTAPLNASRVESYINNLTSLDSLPTIGIFTFALSISDGQTLKYQTIYTFSRVAKEGSVDSEIKSETSPSLVFAPGGNIDMMLYLEKVDAVAEGFNVLLTVTDAEGNAALPNVEAPIRPFTSARVKLTDLVDLSQITASGAYNINLTLTDNSGNVRHTNSATFTLISLEDSVNLLIGSTTNPDLIYTEGEAFDLGLIIKKTDGIAEAFKATLTVTDKDGNKLKEKTVSVPAKVEVKANVNDLIDLSDLPATGSFKLNIVMVDAAGNERANLDTAFHRVKLASVKTQVSSNTNKDMIFIDGDAVDLNLYVQKTDGVPEELYIQYFVFNPDGNEIAAAEGKTFVPTGTSYFKLPIELPELSEHGTYSVKLTITDNTGNVRSETTTKFARISGAPGEIKHQVSGSSTGNKMQFTSAADLDLCLFIGKTDGVPETLNASLVVTDPTGTVIFSIDGKLNIPAGSRYFRFPLPLADKATVFGTYEISYTMTDDAGNLRVSNTVNFSIVSCVHDWTDANCTAPKTCAICGLTEGEALGHSYENGVCTACGYSLYLTFELNKTGDGYIVKKCNSSASGEVVTPAVYNGLPVTSIDSCAFDSCSNLTDIQIPDSVTYIGWGAFRGCESLTDIQIPKGITQIGESVFEGCISLTSITIPSSVTTISSSAFNGCSGLTSIQAEEGNSVYHSEGNCLIHTDSKTLVLGCKTSQIPADGSVTCIGNSAFEYCASPATLVIPDCITSIGPAAFWGCSGLTDITIPDSVTSIGSHTFRLCKDLSSVTLGNGITAIEEHTFSDCEKLTSINIPDSVTSIGMWAFLGCNGLTGITIPNSVTSIGGTAFQYCENLETITIPDSVTAISYGTFYGCIGLTKISIPGSVTKIASNAFWSCMNLNNVTFCGTQEQWDAIEKGDGNDHLVNATLQFHDWMDANCTAPKTCSLCGATEGEALGHTPAEAVKENEIPATPEAEGSYDEVVYCSVCGAELSRNTVVTEKPIVDTVIPDDGVSGDDGQDLTEEQQEIVQQILEQSKQVQEALNLPDNTYLKITMSSAKVDGEKVTRIVYKVKPITDGKENSNPNQKITFYLPVPYQTAKTVASVFHNGILLGTDYEIKTNGKEKWVEVTSDNFSEFSVDLEYSNLDENGKQSATVTVSTYADTYYRGDTVVVTVNVSPIEHCTTGGFMFEYNTDIFELVGGEALVTGYSGAGISTANGRVAGYFMGGDEIVQGDIFRITLKVKDNADFASYTVSGTPSFNTKIGEVKDTVTCTTEEAAVTIICNHSFGEWIKLNEAEHKHICTICSYEETELIDYTVVFQYADGTVISSAVYHYGDAVEVPMDPPAQFANNAFMGWDQEIVSCAGDTVYTAVFVEYIPGDIDTNGTLNDDDAVYLLLYTMFGEEFYPLGYVPADIDCNEIVDHNDAIYLLLHTLFGEEFYPLNAQPAIKKEEELI